MVDEEMVSEVKSLIKDGYSLEKIKANLVKIGYNEAESDAMIERAYGMPAARKPSPPPAPKQSGQPTSPPAQAPPAPKPTQAPPAPKPTQAPPAPKPTQAPPAPAPQENGLEGMQSFGGGEGSDEELLLATDESGPATPVALPVVKTASQPPKPPEHPRHPRRHAPKPEEKKPEEEEGEEAPKSGFGKAFMILLFAFIVIAVLAYVILLPKLGIDLATLI